MKECAVFKGSNSVSVSVYNETERLMGIGQKMEEINPEAYMNGYNWSAFLRCYLSNAAPELLEGLEDDSEAGMCCVYYPLTPENEQKAERLEGLVRALLKDEESIYRLLREHGDEVEWD